MQRQALEQAVLASFIGEIEAFKPGNVSDYADGHDMTVEDFINSANVSTPLICDSKQSLGQRIVNAVTATQQRVGCNTNLGMLLLFVPIIIAAEQLQQVSSAELRAKLEEVLRSISSDDTKRVFQAIALAKPGGLGQVEQADVNNEPDCSLLEAMQLAAERDYVAAQYANNFLDIFESGLVVIKDFVKRWNSVKWATVASYLTFLSLFNDSHIERKYGSELAETTRKKGEDALLEFTKLSDPESYLDSLKRFDEDLKEQQLNPGTSADLTAASLLVYNICESDVGEKCG